MEKIQLKSSKREAGTSSMLKKTRKAGQLPAVLYGHNRPTVSLSVDAAEFDKTLKKAGESTIVELVTDDGKAHPVLIHEVQHHHLSSRPIHVDFYEVSMTEKLQTAVVLEFIGESKAVKELGGVLVKVLNEVEVECLPADLPHAINVDISKLTNFSQTIAVKNLEVPDKVRILTHADEVIAKVQPPRDVEAELAQAPVEDVAAVVAASEVKPEPGEEDSGAESKKE